MARRWERARSWSACGQCYDRVKEGDPILVIQTGAWSHEKPRRYCCEACAGSPVDPLDLANFDARDARGDADDGQEATLPFEGDGLGRRLHPDQQTPAHRSAVSKGTVWSKELGRRVSTTAPKNPALEARLEAFRRKCAEAAARGEDVDAGTPAAAPPRRVFHLPAASGPPPADDRRDFSVTDRLRAQMAQIFGLPVPEDKP